MTIERKQQSIHLLLMAPLSAGLAASVLAVVPVYGSSGTVMQLELVYSNWFMQFRNLLVFPQFICAGNVSVAAYRLW